jgi:hypothetical protein
MDRSIACVLLALVAGSSAFVLQPRLAPSQHALRAGVSMQFGGGEGGPKLTRDNEPDEFFSTNMDDMSDAEKLKSPVVIGGLAILIAPFIIGAIVLTFSR